MKNQSRSLSVILPNNTELIVTVGLKDRVQDVFNQLPEQIGFSELHLFGLGLKKDNQLLFLDLDQKLSVYLPKAWRNNTLKEKVVIYLKVQYFVENAQLIVNENARKLYYAELKGRVLSSKCYEQEGLYFQLAAYSLQADLGDYEEGEGAYFRPCDFFPLWIVKKRGDDYILKHIPALHEEITGLSSSDAVLLFIQGAFTLSDVPLTIYRMLKGKKRQRYCVYLGLASTGLQIFEMVNGEQKFLYDLAWSKISSITFQGRRFMVHADGLGKKGMKFYTSSVLHAKQLLQHISISHRTHLNTKPLVMCFKEKIKRGIYREVCITDGVNLEESEDDLPPMEILLASAQKHIRCPAGAVSLLKVEAQDCSDVFKGTDDITNSFGFEMSVDEPEEMFVDDPKDVLALVELMEGVSVDDPSFLFHLCTRRRHSKNFNAA